MLKLRRLSRVAGARAAALAVLAALAAALAASAPAATAPGSTTTGSTPPGVTPPVGPTPALAPGGAQALLLDCHVAVDQADRSATFSAQMLTEPGTRYLQLRVELLERQPLPSGGLSSFAPIAAPGLGDWRSSSLGVHLFEYVKQVTNLPAPAGFRALVHYRWIGPHGRIVRRAVRRSPICVQPDERARLVVDSVAVSGLGAGSPNADYRITLRNGGRGPAGAFEVGLELNGSAQPPLSVQSLAPAASVVLDAVAPRCTSGSTVKVTPDTTMQVPEAPGGGQPLSEPCPLA